jgi:hypothetical protein
MQLEVFVMASSAIAIPLPVCLLVSFVPVMADLFDKPYTTNYPTHFAPGNRGCIFLQNINNVVLFQSV